ncbi:tyrosinase family protein [Janthinobacterium sp. HLX7-2]|uniref:tyrosinase family protein n=1 Tax=Janthinobacterium sp. HLX7-2 TaxID=1259331 RepID=UPI003F230288
MATTRRQFVAKGFGYAAGASLLSLVGERVSAGAGPAPSAPPVARRVSIEKIAPAQLAKIEAVVGDMMARSAKDPRDPSGWLVNADPHREFCAAPGTGGLAQIHFCYWFLPWHRAYLAVLDRKLRALSGDPSLSFPYWNWSSTRRLPAALTQQGSPLAHAVRFTPARALAPDEVDYFKDDPVLSALGVAALSATKFVAHATSDPIALAREMRDSIGGLVRPNAINVYRNSRMEDSPHGPVHGYVGGVSATNKLGDMTDFATAARDPAFFAHHGNLDRLWEIWRSKPANRAKEPTTSDFLDHVFAFPWIDGTTMQISVADTLDTAKLGYTYDNLNVFEDVAPAFVPEASPTKLPPIVDTMVKLPPKPEKTNDGPPRYLLVLENLASPNRPLSAGVYLSPRLGGPSVLVGSVSVVASGNAIKPINPVLVFDITAAVQALQSTDYRIQVIPNELGNETKRPYQPLRFKRAFVIAP